MSQARLYLGDCLDVMDDLATGSIDMVLCDPPYGTTRNRWDTILEEYFRTAAERLGVNL